MNTFISVLFVFIITSSPCFTQNYKLNDYRNEIEYYLQNYAERANVQVLIDKIEYLSINPIKLTECNINDLYSLPGIRSEIAEKIIDLVDLSPNSTLKFIIDSIKPSGMEKIILGLCTSMKSGFENENKNLKLNFRTRSLFQFENEKGSLNSAFLGDDNDIYQNLFLNYKNFQAGCIISKNPGESSFIDFSSFHLTYKNNNYKIVSGDFTCSIGLGGLLWDSYGARKGFEGRGSETNFNFDVSPNRSSIDYYNFRGIAINYDYKISNRNSLSYILGFSYSNKPGGVDSNGVQTSIYTSGLYRTQNEINKKNANQEKALINAIQYNTSNFTLGLTSLYLQYDKPVFTLSPSVFEGKSGLLSSCYAMIRKPGINLGGEISLDANQNAAIIGLVRLYDDFIEFNSVYRNYSPNFRSPYSNNIGEFSYSANEYGLFSSLTIREIKNFSISIYNDLYSSFKRTSLIQSPVKGCDLALCGEYKMNEKYTFFISFKNELRTDANRNDSLNKQLIFNKSRISSRFEIRFKNSKNFSFNQRFEICRVNFENIKQFELGGAICYDLDWQINETLKMGINLALYSTDAFESAIWRFNYLAPGTSSIQTFYGRGVANSIYLKYSIFNDLNIFFIYTQSSKNSVKSLGSSYDEITCNSIDRLYVQLEYNLR